jgi:hypothetical protein
LADQGIAKGFHGFYISIVPIRSAIEKYRMKSEDFIVEFYMLQTEAFMSTLEKIAYFQGRRDEVPNQVLAKELAGEKDKEGIKEIAKNLENGNKNIRSDCLKVLYEIGYLDPALIAGYVGEFLKLLRAKDNRLVWGAMIGLASIASQRPKEVWASIDDVIRVTDSGTVISRMWGTRTLAQVAAADPIYRRKILPLLIHQLRTCIPRDVPTYSESILCAVDHEAKGEFLEVMESRCPELTSAQLVRYKKVLKQLKHL